MMGMQQMSSSDIYSSMDSDGDGSVTQTEFVSARPDGMSEDDAEALYATIDTENAGSITEEQFTESLESAGAPMGPPPSGSAESDEETYDALDTNQDGVVSEAEFLASRPDDVSEEDAQTIYDMIDSEGTGSISVDQLSEFLGSTRQPPMGPPPGEAADLADATSSTDADYLVNLLSGTYAETEDSDLAA
jgi:Ca2+-binding EF-hand superfamily protein